MSIEENSNLSSYERWQAVALLGGAALVGGAVVTGVLPSLLAITTLALPIVLGVGGVLAWVAFVALTFKERSPARPQEEERETEVRVEVHGVEPTPVLSPFQGLQSLFRENKNESHLNQEVICQFNELLDQLGNINEVSPTGLKDSILTLMSKIGGPLPLLEILLERGIDVNYQEASHGNTALLWAIANANNSFALELIRQGGGQLNLNIQDGHQRNTALHLAVAKGYNSISADGQQLTVSNFELVQELLKRGADPNMSNAKKYTPFMLAVIRRDLPMISYFVEKSDVIIESSWESLLNLKYEEASQILREQAHYYILDLSAFESSKEEIRSLLSALTHQ